MKRSSFLRIILLLPILIVTSGFVLKQNSKHFKDVEFLQQKSKKNENKILLGNWVRTDADYKIKISEVARDGKLKAGYFNPKSVHVGKATWTKTKGILKIHVELRDENYPGSNYNLTYYPEKDMLAGKYFQAVQGETYDVLFARAK
ncbi:hypothetical protein RB619_20835 [Flavobacterium sp. LHD-80]|uniref:hypothetical protein n=1 Tax=Flavobacterium sp. LHD-80 TaxID=3071411 RepID=UPI0027DFE34A|nr:hypothetical protein [Flavobacterium sp. LHD-80]MDQ6473094.1 hypothetical protein [Flavobacterium sp. LHD-80]